MPEMMMLRDYFLRTTSGHMVKFEANKPVRVPPAAVDDAISIGAVLADGTPAVKAEDKIDTKLAPTGFKREEEIFKAIADLFEENDPDKFTATGLPALAALSAKVGYSVDRKETYKMWKRFQEARANAE